MSLFEKRLKQLEERWGKPAVDPIEAALEDLSINELGAVADLAQSNTLHEERVRYALLTEAAQDCFDMMWPDAFPRSDLEIQGFIQDLLQEDRDGQLAMLQAAGWEHDRAWQWVRDRAYSDSPESKRGYISKG